MLILERNHTINDYVVRQAPSMKVSLAQGRFFILLTFAFFITASVFGDQPSLSTGWAVLGSSLLIMPFSFRAFSIRYGFHQKEIITGNLDFMPNSFSKPLSISKSRCDFDVKDDIMVNIGTNGAYIETSASDFTKSNSIQSSFTGNLALDLCPLLGRKTVGNRFDFASQLTVASNKRSVILTSYLVGPVNDLFTMNNTEFKQYPVEYRSTSDFSALTTPLNDVKKSYCLRNKEIIFSNPASVTSAFILPFNSTKSGRDFGSNGVRVSFGSGGAVTDTVANQFYKPVLELTREVTEKRDTKLEEERYTSDWDSVNGTVTISFNSTKSRRDFGSNDNTVSFGSGGTVTVPGPSLIYSSTTLKIT
ncbi:hypothetical protein [Roseivirga misakiensis]|uniref:Uncharacterized protein n=1 Tax=Roseivirga misakiensis TaxID=1563681 RepID=A0A1E5T864_9BACT|nr:hypothetical protein [Roseivirga misakiensis]OEK07507.1 hypothetical protein BFP71_00440 [Roseivirga misakiensis]